MSEHNTSEFFNQYANDFDAIYDGDNGIIKKIANRLFHKSMRLRFEKSINGCDIERGNTVIDIGCGPGHYGVALASKGFDITGIDFAPNMIDIAKAKATQSGLSKNCNYIVGDFLTYQFDRSFDYAIAMGFIEYMNNPEEVIRKIISISKIKAFISFPCKEGFLAWQRRERYKNKCPLYMYGMNDIEDLLKKLNIDKYKIQRISRDYFVTIVLSD